MATFCERVDSDPKKIKDWIDSVVTAPTIIETAIQGDTTIVFVEGTAV